MKARLFCVLLFSIFSFQSLPAVQPATQSSIDSLKKEINDLKKEHEKEFEKNVSQTIEDQVMANISRWAGYISLALAILGGLGIKFTFDYLRKYVNNIAQETVSKKVQDEYRKSTLELEKFKSEYLLDKLLRVPIEDSLKRLSSEFENNVISMNDSELIEKYLDGLIRLNFDLQKDEELTELAEKYKDKYSISATSWANVSIANMFLYSLHGSAEYKKRAFKACDNSLKKLPNYGEPQAVRLIINSLDFSRNSDQKIKEEVVNMTRKVLEEVNAGESTLTAYEVYNYLSNKAKGVGKPALDFIKQVFPNEAVIMEKKYNTYADAIQPT